MLVLGWLTMAGQAQAAGSIAIGSQLEPTSLDPTASASSATTQVLFPSLYEGLVHLAPGGAIEPALATSWEISSDGLTYLFHLRPGVRFHDGSRFDSQAVKFTLGRAISPASTNPQKAVLSAIESVDTPSADSAVLHLRHPYSGLLQVLGWGSTAMLSPTSADSNGQLPIGTGPFRFAAWRRGDAIDLVKNPDYWGRPANLDKVTYKFITDPNAAEAALKAGDVDAFDSYPAPENIAELKADPRFQVQVGLSEAKAIMALNNRRPPLNNRLVRQALAIAIDRRAVIDGAMFGYGEPIGSHYALQDPAYLDLTGLYPHNPEKARALLTEAGYPHGFSLTLKLPPLSYARRSSEIIAEELEQIGVHVTLVNLEWMSWMEEVFTRHDFDATVIVHVEPMDYEIYGRDDYYFGYGDPAFKQLLQRLDSTTETTTRLELLQDIQRKIADDAVNVFLFNYPTFGVESQRIQGLWLQTPVQNVDLASAMLVSEGNGSGQSVGNGNSGLGSGFIRLSEGLAVIVGLIVLTALLRAGPTYVAERLLSLGLVLLAASLLIFVVIQVLPGDPAKFMLGLNATPETLAALRHKMGLEGSLAMRYGHWLLGLARADFGISYTYGVPVASLIGERLPVSLPLTLYALLLSTLLAFASGLWSALHRDRWIDRALSGLSQLAIAIPDFWLGLILVVLFAEELHWVAAGGFPGWQGGLLPALRALTLPAIALAVPQAAILSRVLRGQLFSAQGEDYLRTARAKGLNERQSLLRHALPNSIVPVLTVVGMQASFLLAGSIIIENVFSLPGLGRLVFQAVAQRDLMVVQSVVLVLVFAVVTIAMIVDLACASFDPRWRQRSNS